MKASRPVAGQHGTAEPSRRVRSTRDARRTVDSAVALALLVALGLLSVAAAADSTTGVPFVLAAAASLTMPLALAWRRTRPVRSVVTVYLGALVHFAAGAFLLPVDLLVLVALYSVTAYGPRWATRAGLAGALVGAALQGVVWNGLDTFLWSPVTAVPMILGLSGLVLATWASGLARRARLERLETLEERAHRLEVERDQQAQIAAAAERARIAREMHDVVAHSLSVVIAQADGGRYAARTDPAAAERALTTISETGRSALADMRRILGVLRGSGSVDHTGERLPQPVDADLDSLVEQVRRSGLAVSVVRTGDPRLLPPGVGLSVYRIAQEALTNVLKHAGPAARATVALDWAPTAVVLQVDDDGRGAAATDDGAGQGLVGMRERVALVGGSLDAGPRPGGGFRVRATVPLPAGAPPAGGPDGATNPYASPAHRGEA